MFFLRVIALTVVLFFLINIIQSASSVEFALETEVQLPGDGPWDLQHWMDDSTYGWAQMVDDSLRYCTRLGQQMTTIPLSYDDGWYHSSPPHVGVNLMQLPGIGPVISVELHLSAGWGAYDGWILRYWDVDHNTYLSQVTNIYDDAPSDDVYTSGPGPCIAWPQPPASTRYILYNTECVRDHWGTGNGSITDYAIGHVLDAITRQPVMELSSVRFVSIFDRAEQPSFAVSTRFGNCWNGPDYDTQSESASLIQYWMGQPDSAIQTCSYSSNDAHCVGDPFHYCHAGSIVAQVDHDGTSRMLYAGTCYDESNNIVWTNTALWNSTFSGRVADDGDECFLRIGTAGSGFYLVVFDAATGSSLDTSNVIQAEFRNLIKQPNRAVEVITYDAESHFTHVYKAVRNLVPNVTCHYQLANDALQIRWAPQPHVFEYLIYASPTYSGPLSWVATIPASEPAFYQIVNPQANQEFFVVTARY